MMGSIGQLAAALVMGALAGCVPTSGSVGASTTRPGIQVAGTPETLVAQWLDDLRQADVEAAARVIAPASNEAPRGRADEQRRRLERRAERMSAGELDYRVIESKVSGEVAVVIVDTMLREGRPAHDFDPLFLVRQSGEWRLLYYRPLAGTYAVTDDQATELVKLNDWYQERKGHLPAGRP